MKRRTSMMGLVMAAMMCISLLPTTASAADSDFVIENGVLVGYTGEGGDITIPYGVKEIGSYSTENPRSGLPFFNHEIEITSITIPDSVTRINDFSICGLRDLTSVTIPDSVTHIGEGAFFDTGLTSVTIPNSVTNIGGLAFGNCLDLTSATIGNGVKTTSSQYLGTTDAAIFDNCPNLVNITLTDGLTTIMNNMFVNVGVTSITIPNSVTSIGDGAFNQCPDLASITIPNSVTSIGDGAFSSCSSLTSINIPGSVKSIGDGAFYATALTNVEISDGVTSIGNIAFLNSTALTSVTIPASVTSIGIHAFHEEVGFETYRPLPGLTLSVTANSYAEAYAREEGIPFVSTGSTTAPTTPTTPTDPITPTDPVVPVTPPATDQPSSWAEAQVNGAIAANLVPQDLQSQYTQPTTRAEFCALATALYEVATGAEITGRTAFTDTLDENVQKMASLGVVSGVGDGRFDPEGKLTREQAATMLSRLAAAIGKPLTAQAPTFADNASISAWALDAVGQVQAAGVMGGVGDNAFAPQEDYTREQSILTIGRLFELVKA